MWNSWQIIRRRSASENLDSHSPTVLRDDDFAAYHSRFTWMRDHLASIAPPDRLPGRQHLDPLAIKDVLPLVNLVEVHTEGDTARFRFRLVGSVQTEMAGREITGQFVEEAVLPNYVNRILTNMRAVVQRRAPVYDRFPIAHPDRECIDSERVYFPLAANGQIVDMLILIHVYPKQYEPLHSSTVLNGRRTSNGERH